MRGGWNKPSGGKRCKSAHQTLKAAGIALMAAGAVVVLFCVPGWAWAALLGAALIGAGFLLLRLDRERR